MKAALYRHFDADGRLLYVGVSNCAVQRTSRHAKASRWFDRVATITVEWFASRADALAAEQRAIAVEGPSENVAFSRDLRPPMAQNPLARYMADNGIRQEPFARRIGVTQAFVSKLCGAEPKLSIETALAIEAATDKRVPLEVWPQFQALAGRVPREAAE